MRNSASAITSTLTLASLLSFTLAVPAAASDADNTASDKTLTVYTYDSFVADWGPGPAVKQAFEAQCGCTLDLVGLEDGVSILSRLRLEGKRSKADIILGIDNNLLEETRATGLIAEHSVDTHNLRLPQSWQDNHFVPYDYGYFAFVYNSETLANPPASLKQLVEGDRPLTVLYQDPRTSTPGQGLMLWMRSVYGDDVPQAWEKLAKKTVTVTKGWSEAYGMFLEGEADMVLSYTTSPAYHLLAEEDKRYKAAEFSEGHYLQIEVAAKLKHASEPALADQFLQFMLSPEFQSVIPTTNWMLPVTADVELDPVFAGAEPATALSYSATDIHQHRRRWINEWLYAVSR